MIVAPGATQVSVDVFFADDTGAALTGKVAADFPVCKWSGGSNTADTTITLSDLAAITTAHPNDNTAGGVKEREGGWYRLDLPNNVLTSAGRKTLTFAETTNKRLLAPFIDVQYPQTDVRQLLGTAWLTPGVAGTPDVNAKLLGGTAQTGRDLGASVLLSAGTGAGQLDFTSGTVKANAVQWLGGAIPAVNVTGVPLVDCKYLLGTIFSTPATSGIMDVNLKNIANLVVNAAVAQLGVNIVNVSGSAVSTTLAQIGVNVVNWNGNTAASDGNNLPKVDVEDFGGAAGTFASGRPEVNTVKWVGGTIPAVNVTGVPLVDLKYTLGTISPAAAGSVGIDWAQVANKTAAVGLTNTTISTTQAVASVTGGVTVTTNNDKTGYALTVAPPTAAAIWDLLSAGHTGAGSFGALLASAGAAADPLTNQVPGAYLAGTAGGALGRIGTAPLAVTVVSPVAASGAVMIVAGDDYKTAESRNLTWTDSGQVWPDLTLASSVTLIFTNGTNTVSCTGTFVVRTGTAKQVSAIITAAQSAVPVGAYRYAVVAVFADGDVVTLVKGPLNVQSNP